MRISQNNFPVDFARYLADIWANVITGDYTVPPLPSEKHLVALLETAYLAGMETDEARALSFTLCCTQLGDTPSQSGETNEVEVWPFEVERAFSVQEIRRLSSATDLDSTAIWVGWPEQKDRPPSILGLLNFGSSWAAARRGYQYHHDQLPHALLIRAEKPGKVIAYQGHYRMAWLEGGEITKAPHVPAFDIFGAHSLFSEMQDLLRDDIIAPKYETPREWHSFEWTAVINVVFAIINTIQANGHGGALVLTGASRDFSDLLRIKYRIANTPHQLRNRFVEFMNIRHRMGDMMWPQQFKEGEPETEDDTVRITSYELADAQLKLAEACAFLGNLSGTDGAIVLRTDLTVAGFGAEILLENAPKSEVFSVSDPMKKTKVKGDSEAFGMRHRSAMRLCAAAEGIAVFVISQDGTVSLMWNEEGVSCYTSGINVANANMVLA